jgi:hypothetical protein
MSAASDHSSKIHHNIASRFKAMISTCPLSFGEVWYGGCNICVAKGDLVSVALTHSDRHSGELEK